MYPPGSVAIVTGGAGGIGLSIVGELASHGVGIVVWDREGADFCRPEQACRTAGVPYVSLEVDVRDRDACMVAAERASTVGSLRFAVNCAGIDRLQPTFGMATTAWTDPLDVNLSGVLFSCLAEYALMRESGGAIVNIASLSGTVFNRGALPHIGYSASKAGVIQLSRCLAVEWANDHVRVNAVSPGYTRTEMTDVNSPELNAALVSNVPMRRMAEVEEIAGPVAFLLSEAASYISGHNLLVDGGVSNW
jgi:Dehydrogenases with different specificities (related to short-chain alcohol dehydrogenases)